MTPVSVALASRARWRRHPLATLRAGPAYVLAEAEDPSDIPFPCLPRLNGEWPHFMAVIGGSKNMHGMGTRHAAGFVSFEERSTGMANSSAVVQNRFGVRSLLSKGNMSITRRGEFADGPSVLPLRALNVPPPSLLWEQD